MRPNTGSGMAFSIPFQIEEVGSKVYEKFVSLSIEFILVKKI